MIPVLIALVIFIGIGVLDFFKTKTYDDFLVAGRKQGVSLVTFSLLATIIGGSATVGMISKSAVFGTPWFWWLGVGSIGLLFQSFLLTEKVRNLNAYTLPDVVNKTMGKPASVTASLIIVISWIAIVAAQFLAAAKVMQGMIPAINIQYLLILIAVVIILYAFLGGQRSIMKTDALQFVLISLGLFTAFVILYFVNPQKAVQPVHWEFFNENFTIKKWFSILILTGGAYFIGPDMFSRILTAKDGKTAKKSVFISSLILIVIGIVISLLGAWVKSRFSDIIKSSVIKTLFAQLPPVASWILSIGFISAMISSADTILLTSASIIENDLIGAVSTQKDISRLWITRALVLTLGTSALLIALFNSSIIGLLLNAYSIYTPGIVAPLALAIIFHNSLNINRIFFFAAMLIGGSLGLIANLAGMPVLSLIGFGSSLLIALIGTMISPAK